MIRAIARTGRLIVSLGVLLGPPAALVHLTGGPGWRAPSRTVVAAWLDDPLQPALLATSVEVAAWLLWAAMSALALIRILRRAPHLVYRAARRLPTPAQGVAATLLGTAAVSSTALPAAGSSVTTAVTTSVTAVDGAAAQSPILGAAGTPTAASAGTGAPAGSPTTAAGPCPVWPGDTLFGIAEDRLDDGDRWPEIYALNRGRHFPKTGGVLSDPDVIWPGWMLRMPADATPCTHPADRRTATPAPATPSTSRPAQPVPFTSRPTQPAPSAPASILPDDDGVAEPSPTPRSAPATTAHPPTPAPGSATADPTPTQADGQWPWWNPLTALLAAAGLCWAWWHHDGIPSRRRRQPTAAGVMPAQRRITVVPRHGSTPAPAGVAARRGRQARGTDSPPRANGATDASAEGTDRPHVSAAVAGNPGPATGVVLTGPGAPAAARAVLVAALTAADRPGEVLTDEATRSALLSTAIADPPRLTVLPDAEAVAVAVQEHLLHRSRLLAERDTDNLSDLPDEARPSRLTVITGGGDPATAATLAGLLAAGGHLQLHGVLLGSWPTLPASTVHLDGTVIAPDGAHDRMPTLTVAAARDALRLTRPLPPVPPQVPPQTSGAEASIVEPDTARPADPPAAVRVRVRVLGEPRIDGIGDEPLRAKSLELLVYLAVRGGSASQDAILDDLLPDAPASKAPYRLHTYVYNLRKVCRRAAGPGTYVEHPPHRYALNASAFDIDLWTFRQALRDADTTDPAVRLEALRRAMDLYTGPLADTAGYEWIEAYREQIRRQAADVALALADALTDKPEEALHVLGAAIELHPYTEEPYVAAMRRHAAAGNLDGVRDVQRRLTHRLAEIDATPSPATAAVIADLLAGPTAGGAR